MDGAWAHAGKPASISASAPRSIFAATGQSLRGPADRRVRDPMTHQVHPDRRRRQAHQRSAPTISGTQKLGVGMLAAIMIAKAAPSSNPAPLPSPFATADTPY